MKIDFITRRSTRCGVADYGKRVFDILKAGELDVSLRAVDSADDLTSTADIVIINYHHATLPFITGEHFTGTPLIAIFHEGPMLITPTAVMDADSTALEFNNHYVSPRPLFEGLFLNGTPNEVPTIGSFGFGFENKNYFRIAHMVCKEFNAAKIRLNIPYAEFGDDDGVQARREVERLQQVLNDHCEEAQAFISLEVGHEYLEHTDLLRWLAGNDINVFPYAANTGRGLSSTTDYALSVCRPIAISDSVMFRHLPRELIGKPLKELIRDGVKLLEPVYAEHTNAKLVEKYQQVINMLLR